MHLHTNLKFCFNVWAKWFHFCLEKLHIEHVSSGLETNNKRPYPLSVLVNCKCITPKFTR